MTELPCSGTPYNPKRGSGLDFALFHGRDGRRGIPGGTLAIGTRRRPIKRRPDRGQRLGAERYGTAARLSAWRQQQTEAVSERPEASA